MEASEIIKMQIDILFKEYEHHYDEIKFHSSRYHKKIGILILYFIAIVVLFSFFIFTNQKLNFDLQISQNSFLSFSFITLSFFLSIIYYLHSTILDALTMISVNGSRIAAIEKLINSKIGSNLLVWDSAIMPEFHQGNILFNGWLKPSFLMPFWCYIILILINIIFCIIAYSFINSLFYYFVSICIFLLLFNIYQSLALKLIGINYISKLVNKFSFIDEK